MPNFFLLFLTFLLGFGSVFGYRYYKTRAAMPLPAPAPVTVQPTTEPPITLAPPSQAVSGILTVTAGHAKKYSRGDTEYREASSGAHILLGESIATDEHSSAVATVAGIVRTALSEKSELVFANIFPSNFVLQQRDGKIEYIVSQPISVRVLHSLVSLQPGDIAITVIDTDVSVTVKSGTVRLALVDTDNNTNVYSLSTGDRATIDDAARTVRVLRVR